MADEDSRLEKSPRFTLIMHKAEADLRDDSDDDDDSEHMYNLIADCNQLSVDIENEIFDIHNFIRDMYRLRFPELESLVPHPIDYARLVKKIGNQTDLTLVDLPSQKLDRSTVIAVSMVAPTTRGNPLAEDVLQKTIEACDRALDLDLGMKKVLGLVESKMGSVAPNLSAVVGNVVAAKLMLAAGGLSALARMPACNVQVLGHTTRKNLARVGYLEETEILQNTPPGLRTRATRLLATKSTLAARIDAAAAATIRDRSGANGIAIREAIHKTIEKWQVPCRGRLPKQLPVPHLEQKKTRGGRRLRKRKEKYMVTDMRKLANRVAFGTPEESSLGDGLGVGYGMLAQAGIKRLRVSTKMTLDTRVAKRLKERQYCAGTSSMSFTPVLLNPQPLGLGSGTHKTYFSEL